MKILFRSYPKHIKGYGISELSLTWADAYNIPYVSLKDYADLKIHETFGGHKPYKIEEEFIDTSDIDGFYEVKLSNVPYTKIPYGTLNYYAIVEEA